MRNMHSGLALLDPVDRSPKLQECGMK